MNGLQITGMKISSPAPVKKTNAIPNKPPKTSSTKPQIPKQKKPSINKSSNVPKKVVQKPEPKKEEEETPQKKEQQTKVPQQPIEVKQKDSTQIQESPPPVQQKTERKEYEVMVKYNHYKEKFPVVNDILEFEPVNEKYCFALVFKGNYQPVLRRFPSRQEIGPETTGVATEFTWKVKQEETYVVQIQEDEQQQSKYERKIYKAPEPQKKCCMKKNPRVTELTEEMKRMGIDELGSQKHRALLEQRDLEDILYS